MAYPFLMGIGDSASPGYAAFNSARHQLSGIALDHEAVRHSVSEYHRQQAHANGMESFWAMLKRGYHGTYYHISAKHLDRCVAEFAGRHNIRGRDTIDQVGTIARQMAGKRLPTGT